MSAVDYCEGAEDEEQDQNAPEAKLSKQSCRPTEAEPERGHIAGAYPFQEPLRIARRRMRMRHSSLFLLGCGNRLLVSQGPTLGGTAFRSAAFSCAACTRDITHTCLFENVCRDARYVPHPRCTRTSRPAPCTRVRAFAHVRVRAHTFGGFGGKSRPLFLCISSILVLLPNLCFLFVVIV